MTRVILGFVLCFLVAALSARWYWGGGNAFPDVGSPPAVDDALLDVAFRFEQPPGAIAIASDDTLFFAIEGAARNRDNRLLHVKDDVALPFPDRAIQQSFATLSDLALDGQGLLWVLDHGRFGTTTPTLHAFDIADGTARAAVDLSEHAPLGSHLAGLAVSPDGSTVLIADASTWRRDPALLVHDTASGATRRVLAGHPAVSAQDWRIEPGDGPALQFYAGTLTWRPGLSDIDIDPSGEWLYLAAAANDGLYRVSMADLAAGSDASASVERYSDKPLSAAILAIADGGVLIGDVNGQALHRVGADRRLRTILRSSRLRWIADLARTTDGDLILADSALPAYLLRGEDAVATGSPYFLHRLPARTTPLAR